MQLWTAVTTAFTSMLSLVGEFLTALVNPAANGPDLSQLLPLFAIGIAISVVMVAVKINWINNNPNGLQVGQLA